MPQITARYRPKYFQESEVRCGDGCHLHGFYFMDMRVFELADRIREACGFPLHVNSSIRCPAHNRKVGGEVHSFHLKGMALDLDLFPEDDTKENLAKLHAVADRLNPKGGVGFYPNPASPKYKFVHVDVGPKRRWGTPFKGR